MLWTTVPCWKQSNGVGKCHVQHLISSFHIHNPEQGFLYFFKGKTTSAGCLLTNSTKWRGARRTPSRCQEEWALPFNSLINCCFINEKNKTNQAPGNATSHDLQKVRIRQRLIPRRHSFPAKVSHRARMELERWRVKMHIKKKKKSDTGGKSCDYSTVRQWKRRSKKSSKRHFFSIGIQWLRPPSTGFAHWTSSLNTWGISISPASDKSKQSVSKTDNQLLSLYPFSELKQLNWELNITLAFKKCQKGPQTQQRQVHTRTQSGCLTTGKLFSLPSCFS